MCIAIPMLVTKVLSPTMAVVSRSGLEQQVDTSFSENEVSLGDHVLVFRGTVLRTVDAEQAADTAIAQAEANEAKGKHASLDGVALGGFRIKRKGE